MDLFSTDFTLSLASVFVCLHFVTISDCQTFFDQTFAIYSAWRWQCLWQAPEVSALQIFCSLKLVIRNEVCDVEGNRNSRPRRVEYSVPVLCLLSGMHNHNMCSTSHILGTAGLTLPVKFVKKKKKKLSHTLRQLNFTYKLSLQMTLVYKHTVRSLLHHWKLGTLPSSVILLEPVTARRPL